MQLTTSVLCARYMLFRRLRSTCDLLMMPKEVLTDRHIREEVVPGLSVHKIMLILERFQPDDYASEPLPHGESACETLKGLDNALVAAVFVADS